MKYTFIVEKTDIGYSAFAENEKVPVATVGSTMPELRQNILDAINTYREEAGLKEVTPKDIIIQLDIPQFFEYYNIINTTALAERIGLSRSLLSQYANGIKHPSNKQVNKILEGVRSLGKELSQIELV